jgi:glycosyltransferase involved in cell wall biosynthesis
MINPFFSIIIPTFNRSHSLENVISSIFEQTFESWEIIIVDDGGDQAKTLKVLSKFDDHRLRYFWKQNEERSIARNYGFHNCEGRYVIPLDSDDQILPGHLEKIFESTRHSGELEFFHTSFIIDDPLRKRSQIVGPYKVDEITSRIKYENIFAIGAAAIRRDIACLLPFPESSDAIHGEDWFFYLRIFARYQVQWVDSPSFVYIVHSQSSVNNIDPDRFRRSYDIILTEVLSDDAIRDHFGPFKFRTMIGYQTLGVALQFLICDKRQARKSFLYVIKALKFAPWLITNRRFFVCFKKLVGF